MLTVSIITAAPYRRHGVLHQPRPETGKQYNADIVKNESLRLYGFTSTLEGGAPKQVPFDITFKLGELAEYDSYNFSYTGKIIAIGEKTVTIESYPGTKNAKKHRLDLHQFAWRNYDFNLKEIAKRNHEVSLCI